MIVGSGFFVPLEVIARGEEQGRLASEEVLLQRGEHVVEVGQVAVELESVGIPVGEEAELYDNAQIRREPAGMEAVEEHEGQRGEQNLQPPPEERQGGAHFRPGADDEQRCKQGVNHRGFLHGQQPPRGIDLAEQV